MRRENFHTTIHAGEAFGLPSIWEAVQFCGAERLGHGVRIVDDIKGAVGEEELGRLAAFVRDRRIPLELCPTSNVGTGICASVAEHPIGMLRRLRFRVTLNTDNRLMSATSMTYEMEQLRDAFGWGIDDFNTTFHEYSDGSFLMGTPIMYFAGDTQPIEGVDGDRVRTVRRRRRPDGRAGGQHADSAAGAGPARAAATP